MTDGVQEVQDRLYPVGTFIEKEIVAIVTDPLCAEELPIDDVMSEWRAKVKAFEEPPPPDLDFLDSDLVPLSVEPETKHRIDSVLASYRYYLPPTFELAFVPLQKLVSPQISLCLDQVRSIFPNSQGPLSDDQNATLCLGQPSPNHSIEGAYLGSPRSPPFQNSQNYLYQFSSEDPNIRLIPLMPFKPFRDMNLGTEGAQYTYDVKVIPIAVGVGLPIAHVLKVPIKTDPGTGKTIHRLILANGIHRAFRLMQLGNTHVAALVQTLKQEEVLNPMVDVSRDRLFIPRPLTMSAFADKNVSRTFRWKKCKRIVKVQLSVTQEISYIA